MRSEEGQRVFVSIEVREEWNAFRVCKEWNNNAITLPNDTNVIDFVKSGKPALGIYDFDFLQLSLVKLIPSWIICKINFFEKNFFL